MEEIKEKIFVKRPVLKEIWSKFSSLSLLDYVQKGWQKPQIKADPKLLLGIEKIAEEIYGKKISEAIKKQLEDSGEISTIDHLGVWGHPIFVNSSLIHSLSQNESGLSIVLATESVSLNNTSSWSGCLMWHDDQRQLVRSSLFKDKQKILPVFSLAKLAVENIQQAQKKLPEKFLELIGTINFGQALEQKNFSNSSCVISSNLWQTVFPSAPKLIYLPLETIVSNFLQESLQDSESIFFRLILTEQGRQLWQKYFFKEHTFLFWKIDDKGRRAPISKAQFKDTDLSAMLQNRKLYPSSPLCFAVLLFCGLSCAGGFTQTTWLTQTKENFLSMLRESGWADVCDIEKITLVPTKNFAESSLAWIKKGGGYINPTSLDLWANQKDLYKDFVELAKKLKLDQSLNLALFDIYQVVIPKTEQSTEDINRLLNLRKQILELLTKQSDLL